MSLKLFVVIIIISRLEDDLVYVDFVFCQAKSFPRRRSLERKADAELVKVLLKQLGKLSLVSAVCASSLA